MQIQEADSLNSNPIFHLYYMSLDMVLNFCVPQFPFLHGHYNSTELITVLSVWDEQKHPEQNNAWNITGVW